MSCCLARKSIRESGQPPSYEPPHHSKNRSWIKGANVETLDSLAKAISFFGLTPGGKVAVQDITFDNTDTGLCGSEGCQARSMGTSCKMLQGMPSDAKQRLSSVAGGSGHGHFNVGWPTGLGQQSSGCPTGLSKREPR